MSGEWTPIVGEWVECIDSSGVAYGEIKQGEFYRVEALLFNRFNERVVSLKEVRGASFLLSRFRRAVWEVGTTYQTQRSDCVVEVTEVVELYIRGILNLTHKMSWHDRTGVRYAMEPGDNLAPHLTPRKVTVTAVGSGVTTKSGETSVSADGEWGESRSAVVTPLELYGAIDRIRLSRGSGALYHCIYGTHDPAAIHAMNASDKTVVANAYIEQLDRDACEEATPCPNCDIIDEQRGSHLWYVVVRDGVLSITQTAETGTDETHHDCASVADLRRWCLALKVDMPEIASMQAAGHHDETTGSAS